MLLSLKKGKTEIQMKKQIKTRSRNKQEEKKKQNDKMKHPRLITKPMEKNKNK